nr:hypothetical protein BgiMline_020832 [Biomphalaria glabrata]
MYILLYSLICYGFNTVASSSPGQSCWETYKLNKDIENICHLLEEYVVCYLGELGGIYNETFERFLCQEVQLSSDLIQCLQDLQNTINEHADHTGRLQQVVKDMRLHGVLLYVLIIIIIIASLLLRINISVPVALSLFIVCIAVMNHLQVTVRDVNMTLNCG